MNGVTSIAQSLKLIDLGLDPKTGDMTYLLFSDGRHSLQVQIGERPEGPSFLAAWSFDAMLDALGDDQLAVWSLRKRIMHEGYLLSTDSPVGGKTYAGKTKVDAVFAALVDKLEKRKGVTHGRGTDSDSNQ